DCEARGAVAATGSGAGGFVGNAGGGATRYAECRALGSVATTSNRAGGFAGYVSGANAFWRCFSAGSATASYEVGGFLGNNNGGGTTAAECFALGDATATRTGNDAIAGGFVGYGYSGASYTDCYCLGTVKGERVVGGFAGYLYDSGNTFTRCYAAGALECSGTWTGAFVGYPRQYGDIADCFALCSGDLHAFGTGTAGTSEAKDGIAELNEAGFKDSDNFDAFLLPESTPWTQADGLSQPFLAWSAPDGLVVYASVGGSASGTVSGAGVSYEPGDEATVTAASDVGFFLRWTGSTPYASRTSATTTIPLDNHRVAAVLFGRLIRTADELDAVRNDLAGIYGLGNDIDLAGREWTPIGFNNAKFAGSFYGLGHEIKNMVCTNSPSTQYHGLFGWTEGATLDGISVSGIVKATSYYTGGLVGCANATTIRNCHADVAVSSTSQYTGGLVGAIGDGTAISGCSAAGAVTSTYRYTGGISGGCGNGTFSIRDSVSTAAVRGGESTGGFIGYIYCTAATISGCRADGFASGNGSVGGFVGYIGGSGTVTVSGCAARGDVRSTGANYASFIGYLYDSSATVSGCWSSGTVWGTGGTVGSFVGYHRSGTVEDCAVAASANGGRAFNGGNVDQAGVTLTDYEVKQRSAGWPKVEPRWRSATPISTAAELASITNGGIYRLTADIDLGGATWTPLFQSSGFTGEFYGRNYCISNFTVNTTAQYAGLFGQIAGGRVEGVQAFGTVKSTSGYVGGFAGKIGSYSHVKGCSFVGEVESSSTRVGGFVGGVGDWPTIHRCCAVGSVKKTGSTNSGYVGGFVGELGGGPVADSYARGAVNADGSGYAGGFAGSIGSNARIFTTYCSAPVTTGSSYYVGAFGGYVNGDRIVTNSYHHAVDARQARGQNGSSVAYLGIAPVATADMTAQASFPAFDFGETWMNETDDGATQPYLKVFYDYAIDSFERWAKYKAGLSGNANPLEVVNGIPLIVRYVFDISALDSVLTENNEPVMRVEFDENGEPYVQFAQHVYGDESEVTLEVLATPDITDWSDPEVIPVDLDVGIAKPDVSSGVPPAMFFRWRLEVERP
ncbi:MAG: hypothetical protein IJU44_01015, partial [Kiritimatiellae bacterium]|nr:hypothetical protein [Kiritimatiellia bacterium]